MAARLDERLLRAAPDRREGLRERIALHVISDVRWAEGAWLRPEHLALADRDRTGRSGDEDQVLARAWAARRMTRTTNAPVSSVTVRRFLGLHDGMSDANGLYADFRARAVPSLGGLDHHALQDWRLALSGLTDAHPLTQAAAGFHLWRGFGLSAPERLCEPLVIGARLAGQTAQGGLLAVPIAAHLGQGGDDPSAVGRLKRWCKATREACLRAQRQLDDLEAWRARARAATADLNGKSPALLIRLFEARPVVSAKDCAAALTRTPAQTRQLLRVFEERELIWEITGQKRFRFWKARV